MVARKLVPCAVVFLGLANLFASGCGSSSATADGGDDAAAEAAVDAPEDVAPACKTDVDLTALPVPPGPIGDGGATTTGCYACAKLLCGPALKACNGECDCKSAVVDLYACLGVSSNPAICAAPLITGGGGGDNLRPLGLCMVTACGSFCGVNLNPPPPPPPPPPADGGSDASDGSPG